MTTKDAIKIKTLLVSEGEDSYVNSTSYDESLSIESDPTIDIIKKGKLGHRKEEGKEQVTTTQNG